MTEADPKWQPGGDARLIYPSRYLAAADLRGLARKLKIESLQIEEIDTDEGTTAKAVMRFSGASKSWLVCRTNLRRIVSLHGPDTSAWIGREIEVYPTVVEAFGVLVDAVRARPATGYRYPRKDVEYTLESVGRAPRDGERVRR